MEVGVVYDPCSDELYQTVRDFGAFVNGRRASSSDCTELGNAIVVRPSSGEGSREGWLGRFRVLLLPYRKLNSVAIDLGVNRGPEGLRFACRDLLQCKSTVP